MNNKYNNKYFHDRDVLDVRIANAVKIFMQDSSLKTVLDVGCGTGRLVKFLNEMELEASGCDNSPIAVKIAQKNNKKNSIQIASANKLPYNNKSFDIVTAISVMEHLTIKEVSTFLNETYRILKSHGYIFLVTPNFSSPLRYLLKKKWFGYSDPTHVTFFTPLSIAKKIQTYGFNHPQFWFKTNRDLLTYLLFSTPLCFIRNSFWIAAQKNE